MCAACGGDVVGGDEVAMPGTVTFDPGIGPLRRDPRGLADQAVRARRPKDATFQSGRRAVRWRRTRIRR